MASTSPPRTTHLHLLLPLCLLLAVFAEPPCTASLSVLYTGERDPDTLKPGEDLGWDGKAKLVMQEDCNLVLYDDGKPIWATNTKDAGKNCRAVLDNKGVLRITEGFRGRVIWSAKRRGKPREGNYVMISATDDHFWNKLVRVYGPRHWDSGTGLGEPQFEADGRDRNVLVTGQRLGTGESLKSAHYSLTMQKDCNLVLYSGRGAVWSSGTAGKGDKCLLLLTSEGVLTIFGERGGPVWEAGSIGHHGHGGYALILQSDRSLSVYGPDVWDSQQSYPAEYNVTAAAGNRKMGAGTAAAAAAIY